MSSNNKVNNKGILLQGRQAWFDSLSSPEERAAASAITDVAFIRMFLDLAMERRQGLLLAGGAAAHEGKGLTLEQVSAMYEQYHHRAQGKSSTKDSHTDNTTTITTTGEAFSTTTPMEKVQVSLSLEGTTVASPPASASASASGDHNDAAAAPAAGVHPPATSTTGGDKDDITNNVPTTPRESNRDAMIHNNEEATTTATTTTDELLVSSSNFGMINTTNQTCDVMTIPGSSSSSSSTTIEDNATSLSIQQRDVTNDSNVKEEQTVEQTEFEKEVAVAVPSSTSSSGEEEKESVANNDVLDVLIGHVHALFPLSFSKNVSDLEQLLNSHHHDQRKVLGGDVKVSKGDEFQLESSGGQEEEEEEEGAVMKALVLDPSFLVRGADSFYKLVNDAFLLAHAGRRACDGEKEPSTTVITGVEDGVDVDSMGHAFLSDKLPIARKGCDSSTRFWPSWMLLFSDGDGCGRPIPLDLLLLAGFDFSIESSYRRWLEKQNDGMTPAAVDAVATGTSSSANNDDVWQPFDNFTSSNCDLDLTREIARMYQVRTGLSSHNERILSLVPKDDLTEVQSIICSAEESMTFKIDHLLAAPLTWFTASSLKRGSRLGHEWNTLMKNILSKTKLHAEEFSSSVDEDTKREDQVVVVVDDSNSNIEEPAVNEESTLPKKDSNKEGGSNSILPNNKDAVGSGNSAPPTTSKKGKKKKKKKKRKASNTENNASPAKHAPAVEENTTLVTQENENEEKCDEVKVAVANMEVTPNSTPTPKTSPSKPSVNSLPKVEPPVVASLEKTEKESPVASHSKEACTTTTETKSDPPPPKGKSDPLPPKVKSEPVPSETSHGSTKAGAKAGSKADATDDVDDGAWETVELKTRGRKAKCNNTQTSNKPTSQNNRGGNNNQNHNNNSGRHDSGAASTTGDGGNSHSSRRHRRGKGGKDRRRREQRVVKDVISHILDAVDEEVARRRKQGTKSSSDEKRRSNNEKRPSSSNGKQHGQNEQRRKANTGNSSSPSKPLKSLRDVVAGSTAAPTKTVAKAQDKSAASTSTNEAQKKMKGGSEPTKGAKIKPGLSYKSVIEPVDQTSKPKPSVSSTLNGTKVAGNKAKPIPESNAIVAPTSKVEPTDNSEKLAQASLIPDNNSNSMEEKRRTSVSVTEDEATSPPLSTLLGPNSCSASSSVASSLEAPHSSRFRHQTATEDDVGFHLLNVCGQLSEEINTFMSRRSVALDIRRRERGAVLSALQDTLGKIWPGCCQVEMYGSCATQLDLPSSDLDLVVCGLDNVNLSIHPSEQTTTSCQNSPRSIHNEEESQQEHVDAMHIESMTPDQQTGDLSEVEQEVQYEEVDEDVVMENYEPDYHMVNQQDYYYVPQNYYPPVSLNAQRVMRLASELEQQPWAVQVKAIPTATVPVVKMLADPSRLPGAAASGGNWMMQQHIGTQAGTPPVSSEQLPSSPNQLFSQNKSSMSSSPHYFSPPSLPMWRGADIMNGLQPVDITFEGPEHGGIGSTTYSTAVVQDSCDETGLPPDSTPIVQVAMVLKELLAQRRLNEPFSGGLSSYALLLLLLAVVKDRKIIQNEMEKIEKQRQKVNGSDSREVSQSSKTAGTLQKHYTSTTPLTAAQVVAGKSAFPKMKGNSKEVSSSGGVESAENANINASKPTPASSWASIAKKSNSSTAKTDSTSTLKSNTSSGTTLTTKTGANSSKAVTSNMELCNSGNAETILPNNDLTTTLPTTESHPFDKSQTVSQNKKSNPEGPAAVSQVTPPSEDGNKTGESLAPQGSNDVFDVLCSGELTSGKLLMHFLLFYGQHFDAQNTLIDITASHHSEYGRRAIQNLSPFVARPPGGNIDPVTGMFSVDPIVVYDPLEGAMDHNVAKRCYCWNNVRWVFAQCYMTVSSIVETSGSSTKNSSQAMHNRSAKPADDSHVEGSNVAVATADKPGPSSDALNPILELLLSF